MSKTAIFLVLKKYFYFLVGGVPPAVLVSAKKTKKGRTLVEKMRALYETLRDYKDPKGRQLSLIFLRLPNIKEFPGKLVFCNFINWITSKTSEEHSSFSSAILFPASVGAWILNNGMQTHWNTEQFAVLFSNGSKTRWQQFCSVFQWSGPLENQTFG